MKEAWLKQPNGPWIERFWPNPELERDGGARPMAVDLGRHLLLHEPPLLKSRRQLTLSQARELWRNRWKALAEITSTQRPKAGWMGQKR